SPFAVIASVGTVNTGAIDPLPALADFCRDQGLWLHVDGAFGALLALAPELAPRLAGIERADSLAFDFHKWLHVPYDAACLLVRDGALQKATFAGRPDYLAAAGGLAGGEPWPCDLGFELSRGFKALKVWFTIREQGTDRLGASIAANCAQARVLERLVTNSPRLEMLTPVSLNIVCCRYRVAGWDDERLDRLNANLVAQLHLRGIAAPSTCRIGGKLAVRVCITNHRSHDDDFAVLARAMEEIGGELARDAL
ncbi:MAG TPA: cytochrome D ubiquinol oxidase subunit I, partial [Rhodospirillaceae bacterium]|nr:cytochrome D ubiquinol oxidase subunit I [Rhodospirillaceae bacterium]